MTIGNNSTAPLEQRIKSLEDRLELLTKRYTMNGPHLPDAYVDRENDLQEALAPMFRAIIESAKEAGWGEGETAAALSDMTDSFLLEARPNSPMDEAYLRAKLARDLDEGD